jgi:hypothetical protein
MTTTTTNVLMSQQWLDAMYYVYYVFNVSVLAFYLYVVRHREQWDSARRDRYTHCCMATWPLSMVPFGYWFCVLLEQARDTKHAEYTINVPLYALSVVLHCIGSCIAIAGTPVATDSQTFEYMERTYGCVPGELQRVMTPMGAKRFPVDAFEAWLASQDTAAGPATCAAQSTRRYLEERRVAFNAAIAWRNNAQCRRDYDELCALRLEYCRNDRFCSWDKIRTMRARAEGDVVSLGNTM